jgi:hypothetical protein
LESSISYEVIQPLHHGPYYLDKALIVEEAFFKQGTINTATLGAARIYAEVVASLPGACDFRI